MGMTPIRILIAIHSILTRTGLAAMLADIPGVQLVAEARQGKEVLTHCEQSQVDVVLIDPWILNDRCAATVARLHKRFPEIRILILAGSEEVQLIQQAMNAGAAGILWKDVDSHELASAIHQVSSLPAPPHGIFNTPYFVMPGNGRANSAGGDLTARETEVLAYIAKGLTNAQIGKEMYTSQATIKSQVSSILSKLGVSSRTQAAALASGILTKQPSSSYPLPSDPHPHPKPILPDGQPGDDPQSALLQVETTGRALVTVQDHRFVYANSAYRRFCPYPEIDPAGLRYEQIWTAEEGPTSWNTVQHVIQSGHPVKFHLLQPAWFNDSSHNLVFQMIPMEWLGQAALGLWIWDAAEILPVQTLSAAIPASTLSSMAKTDL